MERLKAIAGVDSEAWHDATKVARSLMLAPTGRQFVPSAPQRAPAAPEDTEAAAARKRAMAAAERNAAAANAGRDLEDADARHPNLARRVRARLAEPSGSLRSFEHLGRGCLDTLSGALDQWLGMALRTCSRTAAATPGMATPLVQANPRACVAPGVTGSGSGAKMATSPPPISVSHVVRWLRQGGGGLPAPLRWPAGVLAQCRVDAALAELACTNAASAAAPPKKSGVDAASSDGEDDFHGAAIPGPVGGVIGSASGPSAGVFAGIAGDAEDDEVDDDLFGEVIERG